MGEADQRFIDAFEAIAKGGGVTGLVWVDHMWDNQAWIASSIDTIYREGGWAGAAKGAVGGVIGSFTPKSLAITVTHNKYGTKTKVPPQTYTLTFREGLAGGLEVDVTVGKQTWDLGMRVVAGGLGVGSFTLFNTQAIVVIQI